LTKRRPSPRGARRLRARAHEKLVHDLERLARLAPGGAPDRPRQIDSPAQVDVIATATPCPLCEGVLRLDEHASETRDGIRLRVARVACTTCGVRRELWFRLDDALPH
jgi:hypothetical protein